MPGPRPNSRPKLELPQCGFEGVDAPAGLDAPLWVAAGQKEIKERAFFCAKNPVYFKISEGTRASVAKWMEDQLMVGSE